MKTLRFLRALVLCAIFASLLAAPLARAKSIPNPSFEADTFTVSPGYASGNGGSISGWTIGGGAVGLNPAGGSPFADNGVTPDGTNVAFIQSAGNAVETLSTTITGLTPGVRYEVRFRANSRASAAAPNASWSLNGGAFASFTVSPAVGAGNPYYTVIGSFTATSNTAPLMVRNQTVADSAVLVDDFRIVEAGDLDSLNFNLNLPPFAFSDVNAAVVQPDGKIIIVGVGFNFVDRTCVARINTNGTIDNGFQDAFSGETIEYHNAAVRTDGKILISAAYGGSEAFRFHTNGSSDIPAFSAYFDGGGLPPGLWSVVEQADGKVLFGGEFTAHRRTYLSTEITTRNRMARLDANGNLDTSFNPDANGPVHSIAVQLDGKIVIGGNFTTVGGIARNRLARLNADGTVDPSFDPNVNGSVNCVAVQPDGRIVFGGNFTTVSGVARNRIARVRSDGTLATFDPNANGPVNSLALQADGKVLLAGSFTTLQPNGAGAATTRNRIARLNGDGTLDLGFDPNANNQVYSVTLQADGMVLLTGIFTTLQPNGAATTTTRNHFARLLNDPATQTLSVLDSAHIVWTRGGSAPQVSRVTFELSTDGGTTWGAPIGAAPVGTTVNWHASGGFVLPTSGQIRARGFTTAGNRNGSAGLVEQVVSFSGITANAPEIVVTGNNLSITDEDTTPSPVDHTDFGAAAFGATTVVRTFAIANTGTAPLNLTGTPKVAVSGTNAADFVVTMQPASPVPTPSGTHLFQVTFTPGAVGVRNATLHLASDDADEPVFDFAVTGRGLSFTNDTDGDGLNDAAEVMGTALGFNWQVSQPALVQNYNSMANGAGLFTSNQIQALNVNSPLLVRNPASGLFTLTIGVQKATQLTNFLPFSMTATQTTINPQGKLEFQFTTPDNAAMFRLESH